MLHKIHCYSHRILSHLLAKPGIGAGVGNIPERSASCTTQKTSAWILFREDHVSVFDANPVSLPPQSAAQQPGFHSLPCFPLCPASQLGITDTTQRLISCLQLQPPNQHQSSSPQCCSLNTVCLRGLGCTNIVASCHFVTLQFLYRTREVQVLAKAYSCLLSIGRRRCCTQLHHCWTDNKLFTLL